MMYIVFSDITLQFKGYIIPFQLNDTNISKYSPIPLPIEHDGVYDYNDKKLTINPETGELYVFSGRSVPNRPSALEYVLLTVKFDPVTNQGSVTQVGTYSNMDPSKLEINDITYDSKHEMLWVVLDNLRDGDLNNFTMTHNQINVKTGVINNTLAYNVWETNENFMAYTYYDMMDVHIGWLYTYNGNKGMSGIQFVYLDPVTLAVIKKFDAITQDPMFITPSRMISSNGTYYVIFVDADTDHLPPYTLNTLTQIDIESGRITSQQQFCGEITPKGQPLCPVTDNLDLLEKME